MFFCLTAYFFFAKSSALLFLGLTIGLVGIKVGIVTPVMGYTFKKWGG